MCRVGGRNPAIALRHSVSAYMFLSVCGMNLACSPVQLLTANLCNSTVRYFLRLCASRPASMSRLSDHSIPSTRVISVQRCPKVRINGVVVTWVVAIDPPGVRFPLNACCIFLSRCLFSLFHSQEMFENYYLIVYCRMLRALYLSMFPSPVRVIRFNRSPR